MIQDTLDFNREEFVKDVLNNDYILVVGSEAILNKEKYATFGGDIDKFLVDKVNTSLLHRTRDDDDYFEDFSSMEAEKIDPQTRVRELLFGKPKKLNAKPKEPINLGLDDMSPELYKLLETGYFRFVFTTTYDNLIEEVMLKTWGAHLRVVNIYDNDSIRDYQSALAKCREKDGKYKYDQPTLFYIFGKAVEGRNDWKFTLTDNNAIEIITEWMRSPNLSDNLINFIKNKKILSLGCQFDDWHMRFFWYILKRDISRLSQGLVVSERTKEFSNFVSYLEQNEIHYKSDTREFINEILKLMEPQSNNEPMKKALARYRGENHRIFFSYCNKDFQVACRQVSNLFNAGCEVWFDNKELFGGHNYEKRISDALSHPDCKIFMPLLTPQIAEDLKNGSTDNYYNREWKIASQNKLTFIPIAVDGYSIRDTKIHVDKFQAAFIGKPCTAYDLMELGEFEKLVKQLKEETIEE